MEGTFKRFMDELKKGIYHPVYFLQGEEPYFIDAIAGYIENNALAESERYLNQVILYGRDVTVPTILNHARRFPMMASRQVVIVREAQDIPDLNRETGSKLLLAYLRQPVPSTILVFCHKHKTLDKRKELGREVEKLPGSATFKKLYDNQLPAFVKYYLQHVSMAADEEGIQLLCELVGNNLSRIVNEIEKIRISFPSGQILTADHVLNQVGVSREYNVFELQKALVRKDRAAAYVILSYFEANPRRNPAIAVVAFLYTFYSRLLMASSLRDSSEKTIISELKISPYAARDYSTALGNYSQQQILKNLQLICKADLQLKGVDVGTVSEGQVLRELVLQLMI
jgi:DNA polymerase-3 subunit delta